MDIAELPFNRLIGLEHSEPADGGLVGLPEGTQFTNHLGTVHAVALLAIAEGGSAKFLLQQFGSADGYVPVVRRIEAKYRKPANGAMFARCKVAADDVERWKSELASRGRLLAKVPVEVVDANGQVAVEANVEWFVAKAAV